MEIFYDRNSGSAPDVYDLLRNLGFASLEARVVKKSFRFKKPSYTSRGILKEKDSWFLQVWEKGSPDVTGTGEFSPLKGLSPDSGAAGERKLAEVADNIGNFEHYLSGGLDEFPGVLFALETALLDLHGFGRGLLFESDFTKGREAIPTNGLIWAGEPEYVVEQINEKLEEGFNVLKMKIGALPFEQELHILGMVRSRFSPDEIEIRLDANGAFSFGEALRKLETLAGYGIHSMEQPIKAGKWEQMEEICRESPVAIALDEELIGITDSFQMQEMLETIMPSYIILKPTLCGGLSGAESWANEAEELGIGWWATSALESNIGLNAISQWVYVRQNPLPQGLGTGKLFTENIPSPLFIKDGLTWFDASKQWAPGL